MKNTFLKTLMLVVATTLAQTAMAQFAVVRHTAESGRADFYSDNIERMTVGKAPAEIVIDVTDWSTEGTAGVVSIVKIDENSPLYGKVPGNRYLFVRGLTPLSQPRVQFDIPDIVKGTYDIYVVLTPETFYTNEEEGQNLPTKFRVYMSDRDENGKMMEGYTLLNPEGGKFFHNDMSTLLDTICVAQGYMVKGDPVEYPDAKIAIEVSVTNRERTLYTRRMYLCGIFLRAHEEDSGTYLNIEKTHEMTKHIPKTAISSVDLYERPEVSVKAIDEKVNGTTLQVESNYDGVGGGVNIELPIMDSYARPLFILLRPDTTNVPLRVPFLMLPGVTYDLLPQKFGAEHMMYTPTNTTCDFVSISDAVVLSTGMTRIEGCIKDLDKFRDFGDIWNPYFSFNRYSYGFVSWPSDSTADRQNLSYTPCGEFDITNVGDSIPFSVELDYGNGENLNYAVYIAHGSEGTQYTRDRESLPLGEPKVVHKINKEEYENVIAPSLVKSKVKSLEGCNLFVQLLELTGLDTLLNKYRDYDYIDKGYTSNQYNKGRYPSTHNQGYTVFAETDEAFAAKGITDVASLKEYLKTNAAYGEQTSYGDDYANEDNAVNQFVAYHILNVGLTPRTLTTVANEYGKDAATMGSLGDGLYERFYVNTWEYWETIGKYRRPVKATRAKQDGQIGYWLNRSVPYDETNYQEITTSPEAIFGTMVQTDQAVEAMNGYVFPIGDVLLWSNEVTDKVLNERMRYDWCTLLPEMNSNNIRQNRSESVWFFDNDYFGNLKFNEQNQGEIIYYDNQGYSGSLYSWCNLQTDELCVTGQYDVTLRLPQVPKTGIYELRLGYAMNDSRGQARIYVGDEPDNLNNGGQDFDFTQQGNQDYTKSWKSDIMLNGDDELIKANDSALREMGYMKGPKYIQVSNGTARDSGNTQRRIVYKGELESGKTYYMRMQCTSQAQTEMELDYIELVPQSVIDAGEDIW